MATTPNKLATLRLLLAERFPTTARSHGRTLLTGIPSLDHATGGLPLGAITEIIGTAPSCGSMLVLGQLLLATRATRTRLALIDASDSFDPASFNEDLLSHLVWVRCTGQAAALQAADLLIRDANLGLVVLDLRRIPARDLRATPAQHWYRLQRAVELSDLALIITTPGATVPSAQVRFELNTPHPLDALDGERAKLTTALAPTPQRQRLHTAAS